LIVTALKLEDLSPEEIGDDEILFAASGLGLDSIDALELGIAIRTAYGIKIEAVTQDVKKHFASVHSLAQFIRAERGSSDEPR
jgi:acyl carrier protein